MRIWRDKQARNKPSFPYGGKEIKLQMLCTVLRIRSRFEGSGSGTSFDEKIFLKATGILFFCFKIYLGQIKKNKSLKIYWSWSQNRPKKPDPVKNRPAPYRWMCSNC